MRLLSYYFRIAQEASRRRPGEYRAVWLQLGIMRCATWAIAMIIAMLTGAQLAKRWSNPVFDDVVSLSQYLGKRLGLCIVERYAAALIAGLLAVFLMMLALLHMERREYLMRTELMQTEAQAEWHFYDAGIDLKKMLKKLSRNPLVQVSLYWPSLGRQLEVDCHSLKSVTVTAQDILSWKRRGFGEADEVTDPPRWARPMVICNSPGFFRTNADPDPQLIRVALELALKAKAGALIIMVERDLCVLSIPKVYKPQKLRKILVFAQQVMVDNSDEPQLLGYQAHCVLWKIARKFEMGVDIIPLSGVLLDSRLKEMVQHPQCYSNQD